MGYRYLASILSIGLICLVLSSCQDDKAPDERNGTEIRTDESASAPGTRILPTLYPTRTPIPTLAPTETGPPLPTDVPSTPIAFDQTVVELSYAIPSIGLERSLRANVSSVLELTNDTTGEAVILRDQIGVIFELQQSLPELSMGSLPEECPGCVQLSYSLPLANLEDRGWLTDTQMLASLENFTAANLQPHFPDGTVLGLRRSATPFRAAHTLALTSDGSLWHWMATDGVVPSPADGAEFGDSARRELGDLNLEELEDGYSGPCPAGAGLESLYIDSGSEVKQIKFVCPELSLPGNLLPLYLIISDQVDELLDGDFEDEPEKAIPLNTLVHFQSSDESKMSLLNDGLVSLTDAVGIIYTQTLTITNIISLTTVLLEDGSLNKGTAVFDEFSFDNLLFVRGPESVYSIGWLDGESPLRRESMDLVEKLLEELLEQALSTMEALNDEGEDITPSPTPRGTPES